MNSVFVINRQLSCVFVVTINAYLPVEGAGDLAAPEETNPAP